MTDNERLNRVRQYLAIIKSAAEPAEGSNGHWFSTIYNHVVAIDPEGKVYDVLFTPGSRSSIYGVSPREKTDRTSVAKHVAVCNPARMLRLCEDIEALLADRLVERTEA